MHRQEQPWANTSEKTHAQVGARTKTCKRGLEQRCASESRNNDTQAKVKTIVCKREQLCTSVNKNTQTRATTQARASAKDKKHTHRINLQFTNPTKQNKTKNQN